MIKVDRRRNRGWTNLNNYGRPPARWQSSMTLVTYGQSRCWRWQIDISCKRWTFCLKDIFIDIALYQSCKVDLMIFKPAELVNLFRYSKTIYIIITMVDIINKIFKDKHLTNPVFLSNSSASSAIENRTTYTEIITIINRYASLIKTKCGD